MTIRRKPRIRFTKHASDKFEFVRRYGFNVDEDTIRGAIERPTRVEHRDDQVLILRPLNKEHALRVVYKAINGNILVVTFYPVKRARFNV